MCLRSLNKQLTILEFLPHHCGYVHKAVWFLKQDFDVSLVYLMYSKLNFFLTVDQWIDQSFSSFSFRRNVLPHTVAKSLEPSSLRWTIPINYFFMEWLFFRTTYFSDKIFIAQQQKYTAHVTIYTEDMVQIANIKKELEQHPHPDS